MRSSRRRFLRVIGSASASAVALPLLGQEKNPGHLDSANESPALHGPLVPAHSAPFALLVNGVVTPMAVDRDRVRFTWSQPGIGRGAAQSAYQILVASSRAQLAAGKGDLWDSGKVQSPRSASVEYAGSPLPPASRLWWKVRIWNEAGKPGPYSAPSTFDGGLVQSDWNAKYIWDGTANPNNFAYFRKAFSVEQMPSRAKIYVTAHNDYVLYLNGALLGRGPARCDPYHFGQYNAYDVTQLLEASTNVFAAIGHWQGNWDNAGVNARPAFLLEARFEYSDGSSSIVTTDKSWKVLADTPFIETAPTYFPAIRSHPAPAHGAYRWTVPEEDAHSAPEFVATDTTYSGGDRAAIRFDSRREPIGWHMVGFDDSDWAPAVLVERPEYRVFAQMAPLEREQGTLDPVTITRENGAWLVDFGRCIDGWPKLTMRANQPGDVVRVEYFQMTSGRKAAGWDEYICRGGRDTWDANFGRHTSFQVLKITGYAGKLHPSNIHGTLAYCDADVTGHFQCSSPLLNSIYKMCVRSAQQNVQQGIISVDADREQSQWLADSYLIGNVLLYNDSGTTMVDQVVRDYAAAQLPDGDFPACCPAQQSNRIPEWSMYWPMLLWQQYLFSGDATLLRELAPRLARFLDWLKCFQDPATKLINPPGWRISEYAGGNMPNDGFNVATACQYYEVLRIASRLFSLLARAEDAGRYAAQAEEVKAGINTHLFNGDFYLARTDRTEMFPIAQAWPLRFDIAPTEVKSKLLAAIAEPGKLILGGYGGDALYSGLLHSSGGTFVVRDLERYRQMLESNKANWEQFSLGGEVNHAWTSYPGYLFLKYICGIQPTSGGFASFDVRPETNGLSFAEGAVPTVKGLITTRWQKDEDGGLTLSVHVPANTRAAVYLPQIAGPNFTISESGHSMWPARAEINVPGVLAIQEVGSFIRCEVSTGNYHFLELPIRG
jgi:alpha-L-rhamnosidase